MVDSLVSRREKRSTAGNRMELALAELALEEAQEDDDIDFVDNNEEQDIFESDFESTDEEPFQEPDDAGDRAVQDEEKRERKIARARADKATALAHARQRVTFHPVADSSVLKPQTKKTKRRVLLGTIVDAETGEVIEDRSETGPVTSTKRHSQRRHTVLNTTATVSRMKDAEEKKAAFSKKPKVVTKLPTQDELIARALDTEEGNIQEHRNYLHLEEEKRARARVVRRSIEGPVLRWISRKEHVKVPPVLPQPRQGANTPQCKFIYTTGGTHARTSASAKTSGAESQLATQFMQRALDTDARTSSPSTRSLADASPSVPLPLTFLTGAAVQSQLTTPQSSLPVPEERMEDVGKNYLVHELGQTQTTKKPSWTETMYAMFGDEVAWEALRVYTSKQRPFARPVRTCPITGLPAPYLDPRSNVPFASVTAFQTLTKILSHEYVWSHTLGCYITSGAVLQEGEVERPAKKRKSVGEAG